MCAVKCYGIRITGIVQGVGFRPFIHTLAKSLSLYGWVMNTAEGVLMDLEGEEGQVGLFLDRMHREAPPLSMIFECRVEEKSYEGYADFVIRTSLHGGTPSPFISCDVSICEDCKQELLDPGNRRYLYPFINCTNCGPRFTISRGVPYDRENTTMEVFSMCSDCAAEYKNSEDRRYHAQPISCSNCGPSLYLKNAKCMENSNIETYGSAAVIAQAKVLLRKGLILAVKGIGGYHLVCDALNGEAVKQLRKRKERDDKPFAVMMKDMDTIQKYCHVKPSEQALLESIQRPIVLLDKREDCLLAEGIAPGNPTLGVMLPYTPIQVLLFHDSTGEGSAPEVLVMTSANRSSEPICYTEPEVFEDLSGIADDFLCHDRGIHIRTDDSVTRIFRDREYILRRSRGYVPRPLLMDKVVDADTPPILAVGGQQKNTFCINRGTGFILSHHIGDLENLETLKAFREGVEHFQRIFGIQPWILAHDLHPEYLSTKYALEYDISVRIPIQHHHAHIASCMAENGIKRDVIGAAFDGTGFGEDGHLWGGEFFYGNYSGFTRAGHLAYVPMPGGEMAVKEPWRMALGYLWACRKELDIDVSSVLKRWIPDIEESKISFLLEMIRRNLQCPLTSSAGRLFDAVSALLNMRSKITYEGQAAMELEYMADKHDNGFYDFKVIGEESSFQIHSDKMILGILKDLESGMPAGRISAKFHETMAEMVRTCCDRIRHKTGINEVVLSGGVFQNMILLEKSICKLVDSGFRVYTHSRVPANDGGIALGQAVIAAYWYSGGSGKTNREKGTNHEK